MKFHPYSEIFPLIEGAEFDALVADIKTFGLREKIWLYDDKILDGRNRFLACKKAGVEPEFRTYRGTESGALALVVSSNINRRHLTESQRAMVAARIATLRHGGDRKSDQGANLHLETIAAAAEKFDVSPRSVKSARKVIEEGSKPLQRAVESGEVSVSRAAAVVDLPKPQQLEAAKRKPEKAAAPEPSADPMLAKDWEPEPLTEEELRAIDEEEDRRLATEYSGLKRDEVIAKQLEEIKRLNALVATLESSRDGYMRGKKAITTMLEAAQRKIARLEKELAKLRATVERAA